MTIKEIRPISDAQAKAAEASAIALREAIQALSGFGSYLGRVFGTVPEDLVGYLGGDRLKVLRAENLIRILRRSKELNDERKIEPEKVSISLALPLLVAAADENRDELVELWAQLLAAASDPSRAKRFRVRFIEVAKRLDPLDAFALKAIHRHESDLENLHRQTDARKIILSELGVSWDELATSLSNLKQLDLVTESSFNNTGKLTSVGREFLRAVGELPTH